jgi:hypothetical protein
LSLEEDLQKIIGNIWYVRDDFGKIVQNRLLLRRAKLIQDVVALMSDHDPKEDDFADRLILDNSWGAFRKIGRAHV